MHDRWAHLLNQLRERFPLDADVADVEAFLSSQGYDRREIGEIVSAWVSSHTPATMMGDGAGAGRLGGPAATAAAPVRVMGPHERGRFTAEAWGHLLALSHTGVVNPHELEGMIDRALAQIDGRIALDDLRTLIESGGGDDLGPPPEHATIH